MVTFESFLSMKVMHGPQYYHKSTNRERMSLDLGGLCGGIYSVSMKYPNSSVQVAICDGAGCNDSTWYSEEILEYAHRVLSPYILSQLQHVERLYAVFDQYLADSLKAQSRSTRGEGVRRRAEQSSVIPGNWQAFPRSQY